MEGDTDTDRLNEVGIVGAGLAGTALAIALKQSGLAVRLYEQLPEATPPSDELVELTANGSRVLHALGLKKNLAAIAVVPQFTTIRHARTGFLLNQRPLGAFSDARYGAPDCLVRRQHLEQMLRQAAIEEQIPIQTGTRIRSVDTAAGILSLDNGEHHRHLAVAVACGRQEDGQAHGLADLLETRDWRPHPVRVARAVVEPHLSAREHGRFINTWVHGGLVVVEQPLPDSQQVALTVLATSIPSDSSTDTDLISTTQLAGLHGHLRELLADAQWTSINTPSAAVASYWYAGRTVLLGDVCHAHPVFPSLCPSAALEDAWVLSRMMERWEESPHEGFPDYARYRKPRADRLRAFAAAELETLLLEAPTAAWQRNLKWSLTSRFLPEIAMQRLDWLYGYDCIKGFA